MKYPTKKGQSGRGQAEIAESDNSEIERAPATDSEEASLSQRKLLGSTGGGALETRYESLLNFRLPPFPTVFSARGNSSPLAFSESCQSESKKIMQSKLRQLSFFKRGNANNKMFVQGKGAIRLSSADFKAQGGEGSIFVKGSTAYKIYSDPQRTISPIKIQELSVLSEQNIIRPLELILDNKNNPIGYSMRSVSKSFALCQLFPKAFRQRNNLTPERTLKLVRKFQDGVKHIHSKGILIVDLNELNFLVAEDFSELYFIDVDSYQTPSFPATVLMESVRDRHATNFTTGSDWFSFAVVSFQMFVGIHPFKGTHPSLRTLDERMQANVSVLNKKVSVPQSCLPFSQIPHAYLDWYQAVFETGERVPPPDGLNIQVIVGPSVTKLNANVASKVFDITEFREFDSEVLWHNGAITLTEKSIYFNGRQYPKPQFDVRVTTTPKQQHLIVAYMDGVKPRFVDLTANLELGPVIEGESIMLNDGRLYVKQNSNMISVEFLELPNQTLLTCKVMANVMMKSTSLFEGMAIQNMLGASYASIPSGPGVCHQVRLSELDGYQVIDARLTKNVAVVVATKAGVYDKLIFRFADDFSSYDVRVIQNVSANDINFTVLDSGVVISVTDEGSLEVFSRFKHSVDVKQITDPAISGDTKLFHVGKQSMIARNNKLFKISMRTNVQ